MKKERIAPIAFSVITPTWNRGGYLSRVCNSLRSQSLSDFEWIVADDGSTDGTAETLRALMSEVNFPVIYVQSDLHVGKARMDNEAVRLARGQLVLWCDSDDWLMPDALEKIWQAWQSVPEAERGEYSGVVAFAATQAGAILELGTDVDVSNMTLNAMAELCQNNGDALICTQAGMLKANPFPEVDLVIPEGVVWSAIGHRPVKLMPETLLMKEYGVVHAVSYSGVMSYNRGRAYAMAGSVANVRKQRPEWHPKPWSVVTFIRYCCHGDISWRHARALWGDSSSSLFYWGLFPLGLMLAFKDALQGKVRKSHKEFEAHRSLATIRVDTAFDRDFLGGHKV